MAGKRHEDGEICSELNNYVLARGWIDEHAIKAGLKAYWDDDEFNESFRITNISHEWMRFVPAPGDPDYSGYYHIAKPHSRGATKMTSAQIKW